MKKLISALGVLLLGSGLALVPAISASAVGAVGTVIAATPENNSPGWWANYGEHEGAECYSHDDSNSHGSITDDGLTVTLNAFGADWPGDHWETLAIKAGNEVNVISHPTAGVAYASPNNPGGNQAEVSHWIVCKGTTPEPEIGVASASASTTPGTCQAGGGVSFSIQNANWDDAADTSDGSRTATAFEGFQFAGELDQITVTYTIPGPDRSLCGTIATCPPPAEYATSTNLTPEGWSLKPARAADGTAAWVDGGLKLDASDNTGSAWAVKTLPAGTRLSQIGDLTTNFVGTPGQYWGGIILEGGDLTAQLHYDDNGRFWTTQAGIFGQDRAGYYQSFPIDSNGADVPTSTPALLSDPIIGTIKIYVNSGQSVVVESQSFLCGNQPFDYVPPVACPAVTTQQTVTDVNRQGWEFEGAELVPGGVRLTASNWSDAYVFKETSFPLNAAGTLSGIDLDITFEGGGVWAIILETAGGNVHYEPTPYSDPFWTNAPGILPANAGGQGGPYSGSLDDLLSNPEVTGVYLYFSTGSETEESAVIHSGTFNCLKVPFTRSAAPQPVPSSSESSEVDCETELYVSTIIHYLATPYWDGEGWVLGAPVETSREFPQRPATNAELNEAECPGPEEPELEPTVTVVEQESCEVTLVTVTTTTTTPTHAYDADARAWIAGEDEVDVVVSYRNKTVVEDAACAIAPPPAVLAFTGSPEAPYFLAGWIALGTLMAGAALVLTRRRKTSGSPE